MLNRESNQCYPYGEIFADHYDVFYQDKNYEYECNILEKIFSDQQEKVHHILDLGCGTGGHAIPLAYRGYQVVGIDRSEAMLSIARQKGQDLPVQFESAEMKAIRLGKIFDIVICMFTVLGYQTSNQDLLATLQTVRSHLRSGGLFIASFWYGPAVLLQGPSERVKIIQNQEDRVIRIAHPSLDIHNHLLTVSYRFLALQGNLLTKETYEEHCVRFFFKPEIDFFLSQAGFKLIRFCPFPDLDKALSEETWNVVMVAQAL